MSNLVEVKVPDIGDFSDVPVIDLFVKVGDPIKVDDAICTLESDKATMDVPSTVAGTVKEVLVQLGSKVSEGSLLIKVEAGAAAAAADVSIDWIPVCLAQCGERLHGLLVNTAVCPPHEAPAGRLKRTGQSLGGHA